QTSPRRRAHLPGSLPAIARDCGGRGTLSRAATLKARTKVSPAVGGFFKEVSRPSSTAEAETNHHQPRDGKTRCCNLTQWDCQLSPGGSAARNLKSRRKFSL